MAEYFLTETQLEELAVRVEALMRQRTKSPAQVEVVSSLEGLTSFPTIQEKEGIARVVRTPMTLLGEVATNAVAGSIAGADQAAGRANQAADRSDQATDRANDAATVAMNAAQGVQEVIDEAEAVVGMVSSAADNANQKATLAEEQGNFAQQKGEFAQQSGDRANTAAGDANAAAAEALEVAAHPVTVGTDGYVYVWNRDTKAYDKTGISLTGEPFRISKVYGSQAEMMADFGNPLIGAGAFVLINTEDVEHEHNAQIFIKTDTAFEFVVDMSGAQGFTGKTPQFLTGNVTTGAAGSAVAFTLSPAGEDEEGNPRILINLSIPRGDTGKPCNVLPNGNYGNWNEETGVYDDSGVSASATIDFQNTAVEFTVAEIRENIQSGETLPVIMGKIRKHFADLGALAYRGSVDYTDVANRLQLASTATPKPPGAAAVGTSTEAARADHVHAQDSAKANDNEVVKLAGAQTIAGVKTFSASPVVPTPTTDMQTATKKYVDDATAFSEVSKTGSTGTAEISALANRTIYRFSSPVNQVVISNAAAGWGPNSMAHICLTWGASPNATPITFGSSGVTLFGDTKPTAGKSCEISIFNNKAILSNGN